MLYKHTNKLGFTLIELLVVMAILGILVSVAASTFQTSRIKGKDAKRKSDLRQVQTALEAYIADHGLYPAATNGQITACGAIANPTACAWGSAFADGNGTVYMAQLPNDTNSPTQQYIYVTSSDLKKYQIYARLENNLDPDIKTYNNKLCPDVYHACNFGVSSSNAKPSDTLP